LLAFVVCALEWTTVLATPPLSPSEQRGERLYFTGQGASGEPVEAFFGPDRIPVYGGLSVCSSCHGYDGLGRPESGILPSDITWKNLTKSYGHVHASGVHHPPYDRESLKQLLTSGLFPGGEEADPTMPVYTLEEGDFNDLLAYLRRLGTLRDPGVGEKTLRIGFLHTADGPTADTLAGVLQGVVDEVNGSGGIYGRRLELVSEPLEAGTRFEQMSAWLVSRDLFALVSPFTPGAEEAFQATVKAAGVPVIGPYTLYPPEKFSENRTVFSLFPGVVAQLQLLREYLAKDAQAHRVALVYADTDIQRQEAEALRASWRDTPWEISAACRLAPGGERGCVEELAAQGIRQVVFLAFQSELSAFMQAAREARWSPQILSCGALAGSAPADAGAYPGELLLSYPTLSRDRQPRPEQELRRLAGELPLTPGNVQAAVSAAVAMRLLVQALQNSGRDLDRRKLVGVLEKLYRYETGLTPPLTFTVNRRVGSQGIYVVRMAASPGEKGRRKVSFEWYEAPP